MRASLHTAWRPVVIIRFLSVMIPGLDNNSFLGTATIDALGNTICGETSTGLPIGHLNWRVWVPQLQQESPRECVRFYLPGCGRRSLGKPVYSGGLVGIIGVRCVYEPRFIRETWRARRLWIVASRER